MSKSLTNRLKRINGQITTLEQQISADGVCGDVIPQFLAVKGALNAAFLVYLKDSIATCKKSDRETLEQLLSHLVKN